MDAGDFFKKLLGKCLESVQHKYDAFRNIVLNLTRCNYCNDVGGNIENLGIKRVNAFDINQGNISLLSLLYAYFASEISPINVLRILHEVAKPFKYSANFQNSNRPCKSKQ